ncbi:hypothetical protein MUG84_00085 [Paenibacillus sp. KQZ6P-2]|uniref:Uncharacterized protein n=1 Tax=Paenibacillus mangrovi TaxID=2931978 RepID=A0A9X1WM32_9BACL|nr:hypothetical protein [Paenibacillus mangrovi]MCJ8010138.1 hypothetical protein [Paenibacillus mangrovi]
MSVKPYLLKLDICKPREKAIYDYLNSVPKKHTIIKALELLMKLEGRVMDNMIQNAVDTPPVKPASSYQEPSKNTTVMDGFPDFDS